MRLPRKTPAVFLGLSLAALAAATALAEGEFEPRPQPNSPATAVTPARCEIALDAVPGGTRLEARLNPGPAARGTFEMTITSRMGGGRTAIRQSGEFDVATGEALSLSETTLVGSPSAHEADLTLRIGRDRLVCGSSL